MATKTLADLTSIDQFVIKADTVLNEARNRNKAYDFDLAVRRGQEAFELYTKSVFLFVRSEFPKEHDVAQQIYELSGVLRNYDITSEDVAVLVLANSTLHLWRLPSFYGDERLRVVKLFGEKEANLAISYAERASFLCARIRSSLYRQLS